jgi:hypothetical protein
MLTARLKTLLGASVIVLGAIASGPAYSCGWAWEVDCTTGTIVNDGSYDFGIVFNVSGVVGIDELGFSGRGLNDNPVTLYRCFDAGCSDGFPIVSTTVRASDPVFDYFRWRSIAPGYLGPGTYEVAGVSSGNDYVTAAQIVFERSVQVSGEYWAPSWTPDLLNASNAPNFSAYPVFWGGPNVYTTPEASTWTMMLLGFVGLGYSGYRRMSARMATPAIELAN